MFRKIALLIAATLAAVVPASASIVPSVIATGPGGFAAGYMPPATVAQQGGPVTYVNADTAFHDVVAKAYGPGTQPWCADFPVGRCPVFWSALIGAAKTTPVLGTENLVPLTVYDFTCSIHPNMVGRLVALPSAG